MSVISAAEFARELAKELEKMRQINLDSKSRAPTKTIESIFHQQASGWGCASTALKIVAAKHGIELDGAGEVT